MNDLELLKTSARVIEVQVLENQNLLIAIDPDLADFLGACVDEAVNPDDFDEGA